MSATHCRQAIAGNRREGRVGRLMRMNGISVKRTRKYKVTTDSNHSFNIAPNLLNQNFYADRPNQKSPLGDASIACQVIGRRHQLCLDARGLAVSGSHPGFAFPARHWLAPLSADLPCKSPVGQWSAIA